MELQAWIVDDLEAVRTRFLGAVVAHVPRERWRERADGGGSSIAALVLHVAVHQDLATHTALGGQVPLFASRAGALGLGPHASPLASLEEAEDPTATNALDLAAVEVYATDVHGAARAALEGGQLDLAGVPPAGQRLAELGGIAADDAPWLHDMRRGKPAAWFVRWALIGHAQGHVGEMVSVRDRLGYRPFLSGAGLAAHRTPAGPAAGAAVSDRPPRGARRVCSRPPGAAP